MCTKCTSHSNADTVESLDTCVLKQTQRHSNVHIHVYLVESTNSWNTWHGTHSGICLFKHGKVKSFESSKFVTGSLLLGRVLTASLCWVVPQVGSICMGLRCTVEIIAHICSHQISGHDPQQLGKGGACVSCLYAEEEEERFRVVHVSPACMKKKKKKKGLGWRMCLLPV